MLRNRVVGSQSNRGGREASQTFKAPGLLNLKVLYYKKLNSFICFFSKENLKIRLLTAFFRINIYCRQRGGFYSLPGFSLRARSQSFKIEETVGSGLPPTLWEAFLRDLQISPPIGLVGALSNNSPLGGAREICKSRGL